MKRAAGFMVCPPSILGKVRVFVRAVIVEMGKNKGGTGGKVSFVGKVKNAGGKEMHHRQPVLIWHHP